MNYTDKKYYEACEEIYSLMFKYTIHILRFEPPIKKIRAGDEQFIKYSKLHIYNYGMKQIIISSNFLNYVKNKDKVVAKIGLIRTLKRRTFGHLISQHSDSDVGIYSDTFC